MDSLIKLHGLLIELNNWIAGTLGIDIQGLINKFSVFFIKYFAVAFNFLVEVIKKLAGRV